MHCFAIKHVSSSYSNRTEYIFYGHHNALGPVVKCNNWKAKIVSQRYVIVKIIWKYQIKQTVEGTSRSRSLLLKFRPSKNDKFVNSLHITLAHTSFGQLISVIFQLVDHSGSEV